MNAIALGLERVQRGPGRRAGDRRRAHRHRGARGLLLRQRGELPGGDREPAAACGSDRRPRAGARAGASARCGKGSATSSATAGRGPIVIIIATFGVFGFSFMTMMPVFARDVLHLDASGLRRAGLGDRRRRGGRGALHGRPRRPDPAGAAGARLLGAVRAGPDRAPRWRRTSGPPSCSSRVAGCIMALNGIAAEHHAPARRRPTSSAGRVMGFYSFVVLGLAPFGSLQAGWVAEHFGVRIAVAAAGRVPGRGRRWPGGCGGRGVGPGAPALVAESRSGRLAR